MLRVNGPGDRDEDRPVATVQPTGQPRSWGEELAALPSVGNWTHAPPRRIAVGSGKGGVGKTVVSSSLAAALTKTPSASVLAIDVDLGGANLHNGLGVKTPEFALNRFVQDGTSLTELAVESGIPGLRLIAGASDILGLSEFSDADRRRFLAELDTVDSDVSILDLGAGSSLFNLDLFSLADEGVLVTTPEPTAIQNAYGFLRAATYRRIRHSFRGEEGLQEMVEDSMNHRGSGETSIPVLIQKMSRYNRAAAVHLETIVRGISVGLVINMAEDGRDRTVGEKLVGVVERHLGVELDFLGVVFRDEAVPRAIREWQPRVVHDPDGRASKSLTSIAGKLQGRMGPVANGA